MKQEHHTDLSNVSVDVGAVATNHINKFPNADSAFTNDFSLLPKFVLMTDTLEHLKNCGKTASRKSENTFIIIIIIIIIIFIQGTHSPWWFQWGPANYNLQK